MVRIPRRIFGNPLEHELGFGKNVTTDGRMMNPDGTFNVERQYLSRWDNTYFHLVTMPWSFFFLLVFGSYLALNLVFTGLFLLVGTDQLMGMPGGTFWDDFAHVYFFSTQTLTTTGYGHISPVGFTANVIASLESFMGLLTFALISGLLYGRFSRPTARIVFSENVLMAPYRNGKGLMFRMGNARKSELLETEVQVILAMNQRDDDGMIVRKFYNLPLEISKISFFSLSWTVVHEINEQSSLFEFTKEDLIEANTEILVLVKGTDEANQQLVHARRSYIASDFIWNARFRPVITRNPKGLPHVLVRQLGTYEELVS